MDGQQLSRQQLIKWVNEQLNKNYTKLEQLYTGVSYCELINVLNARVLPLRKIQTNGHQQHHFLRNYKLLQAAFQELHIRKDIDIERLMKGSFQQHFDLLKFIKCYFDQQHSAVGHKIQKSSSNNILNKANAKKTQRQSLMNSKSENGIVGNRKTNASSNKNSKDYRAHSAERLKLTQEIIAKRMSLEATEKERQKNYDTLLHIEESCDGYADEPIVKEILSILYVTNDEFEAPKQDSEESFNEST